LFFILTDHQAFINFACTILVSVNHRTLGFGMSVTDTGNIDAHQFQFGAHVRAGKA